MLENFGGADTWPAVTVLGASGEAEALAVAHGFRLAWTACHYGGRRPWLLCPRCGRRCANLYQMHEPRPGEGGCRLCWRLGYSSRRLVPMERWARQAQRLRERLGGEPDLSLPYPPRPAGMHRKTYTRLLRRIRSLERACYDADLEAWARMAGHEEVTRSARRYWQASERFLAAYAPSRRALFASR